jgi:hypothetical protein
MREVGMRLSGGQLVITPDQRMLTDPATAYPVAIDPTFETPSWPWAYASQTGSTRNDGILRVGRDPDGSGLYRSFFNFPIWQLTGKVILRATFRTMLVHSWSCAPTPVNLWTTGLIASTPRTPWAPGFIRHLDERSGNAHKGPDDCGNQPDKSMEFGGNLTSAVAAVAAGGSGGITLGLSAYRASGCCEATKEWWKKFTPGGTVLSVEYDSVPRQPVNLATDPAVPCVTGAGRPFTSSATPTLKALVGDDDGADILRATFHLVELGVGDLPAIVADVPANTEARVTVPPGRFLDGHSYGWFVRAADAWVSSPWSVPCEFTVDTTAPTAVPGVASDAFPEDDFGGIVGQPGAVTFSAGGVADVDGYVYGLNVDPPSTQVTAISLGGQATVQITPTLVGPNRLLVRSRDRAGNLGPIRTYTFFARSP